MINARVDSFIVLAGSTGSPDATAQAPVADAVERARLYHEAGADCVYPIVAPRDALAEFTKAVDAPVNALYLPGGPSIEDLAGLGVARITFGGGLYNRTADYVRSLATELGSQNREA